MHSSKTLALGASLIVAVALLPFASSEVLHASVVFTRTGEHIPGMMYGDDRNDTWQLTSLGAHQLFSSGQLFRQRYLTPTNVREIAADNPPIQGLSQITLEPEQLYVLAVENQNTVESATAFMQGLYPPASFNSSARGSRDATALLADGDYLDYPMGGYQYPFILGAHPVSQSMSIWVAGADRCNALTDRYQRYASYSDEFQTLVNATREMYVSLGTEVESRLNSSNASTSFPDPSYFPPQRGTTGSPTRSGSTSRTCTHTTVPFANCSIPTTSVPASTKLATSPRGRPGASMAISAPPTLRDGRDFIPWPDVHSRRTW